MTATPAIDPIRLRPTKRRASFLTVPLLALGLTAVPFTVVLAADGTWTKLASGNASGSWDELTNWSGGIASGSGFTAYFNTLDITAASTVTLGSAVTIGNLVFGDAATSSAASWTLSNGGTAANTLTLAGTTPTITVNALGTNASTTISAKIVGTDGLTKAGAGNLVLNGANTYTGSTNVNAGLLTISAAGALGSGAVTIAGGATLKITAAGAYTLNNSLSGSGTLHLNNLNNTTTISTDNSATYSGQVKVERMTLAVGHDGALGSGGSILFGVNDQASGIRSTDTSTRNIGLAIALTGTTNSTYNFGSTTATANGNLNFTNPTDIALGSSTKKFQVHNRTEFAAGFTGTGTGITMQSGTGTLVLSGTNTYTGATTINAGTLQIGNGGTTGSLTSSAITNNSALLFKRSDSYTVANTISGTGSVTQDGTGTLIFSTDKAYSGTTVINQGTLQIGNDGTTGSLGAGGVTNNGSLVFKRSNAHTVANAISGTGSVTHAGSGSTTLTGANSYSGGTTISAGTLALSGSGSLGTGAISVANGAALDVSALGSSYTVASGTTLTNNGTVSGSVVVAGTLKGAGTFSGNTTITGTHNPGNSPDIQTFNNLAYDGATVNWELTQNTATQGAPAVFDQVIVLGDLSFAGLTTLNLSFNTSGSTVDWADSFWGSNQSWLLFDVSGTTSGFGNLTVAGTGLLDGSGNDFGTFLPGSSFSLSLNGNDVYLNYTASAIPEPSTYAAIAGALALGAVVWRRRRRAQA